MPCQVHRTVDGRENVENGRKSTSKLRTVVTLGDAHTMGGAMTGGESTTRDAATAELWSKSRVRSTAVKRLKKMTTC